MTDGITQFHADGFDVWCLQDGTATFEPDIFPGLSHDEQISRLEAAGETEIRTAFNAYLIVGPDQDLTLVDTGCGSHFGANGGGLAGQLQALDVAPEKISRLVFTHLHTDHCGGAVVDGKPVFPNAQVFVHPAERAYWAEEDAPAQEVLAAYASQTNEVGGGEEIAAGLSTWALPGHTPGHMGLRVGTSLVIVADVMHAQHLQLGEPRLCPVYDMDPAQATDSRLEALREIAGSGLTFAGCHLLAPTKFAKLAEVGDGFVLIAP